MLNTEHKLIAFTCNNCGREHTHGRDLRGQLRIIPKNQNITTCAYCGKKINVSKSRIILNSYDQIELRNSYVKYSKEFVR